MPPRQCAVAKPCEPDEVLDLIARLVDKSLVVVDPTADGGMRYRMLETVRQYAHGRLVEIDELEVFQRRHSEHFLALAETADRELAGPRVGAGWLAWRWSTIICARRWCGWARTRSVTPPCG